MPRLAIAARERAVRDAAQQRLKERVLAALGRSWVVLVSEDLLGDESAEELLGLGHRSAPDRGDGRWGEALTQDGRVLHDRALRGFETVEPRRDQGLEGLRHVELLDLPGHHVPGPPLRQEAAIQQHPHGLDGV